jgi:hypothetical protein
MDPKENDPALEARLEKAFAELVLTAPGDDSSEIRKQVLNRLLDKTL